MTPEMTVDSSVKTNKARVLLIDDHPIVRQGLTQLITSAGDMEVCGEASTAAEALALILSANPDVAVVDISLSDRNGVDLIKEMAERWPALPALALSMYDESMYALRVLRAGGRGYVMKQEPPKKIMQALRQVLSGQVYVSESMATRLVDHLVKNEPGATGPTETLSDRELEVLTLIGRGQSTKEIADALFLSVKTIEAHKERIKEKLKLRSATELTRYAVQYTLDTQPASTGRERTRPER